MKLEGKVAIVTGSSKGIGRAVSKAFAKEGARVVVESGSDLKSAAKVATEIEADGGTAMAARADVTNRDEVRALLNDTIERFDRVDILVNNAGIVSPKGILEMSEEQWDRTIAVHLKGTFNCTQAIGAHLVSQKSGKIINISAPSAVRASSGYADYSSAKGAIISLTKSTAKELAMYNINVNCIIPVARTEMTDKVRALLGTSAADPAKRYPLGYLAQPEDIAPVFTFFASDDSKYVTGQVLAVDGGLTI